MKRIKYWYIFLIFAYSNPAHAQLGPTGPNDTIKVAAYRYGVDSFAFYHMEEVPIVRGVLTESGKKAIKERKNLRRYIQKVYPLAIKASDLVNEIRKNNDSLDSKKDRRKYKKSMEKKVKEEFTDQIKNLYIGEGKVLTKLIYRETGETCYDIIKEMKTGVNARFWQTVSFFFNGNLKQKYDPTDKDYEMEQIVKEVAKWYGRK
jgi:Domain of unknown function (DUF4294)